MDFLRISKKDDGLTGNSSRRRGGKNSRRPDSGLDLDCIELDEKGRPIGRRSNSDSAFSDGSRRGGNSRRRLNRDSSRHGDK